MKVEIEWKESPPRPSRIESQNAAILAELKKNPGRWALLLPDRSSSGAGGGWKKLGCEVVSSRKNPGEEKAKYDIYVRWPERKVNGEGRVVQPAGTQAKPPVQPMGPPVRPAGAGTYDPGLGRAARGVPEDGLPVSSLTAPRRLADRPQA